MRVLMWHGWLLEGTGSNVFTARVAEGLAADGHDVVLLCQEGRPERYPWVDATGTVGAEGVSDLTPNGTMGHPGRCILLRPDIGQLLPVFVLDEYEGFDVRRFVDLTDTELERYLSRNVEAVRRAVAWQDTDVVITGHAVPGGVVGKRAVGGRNFVTTIHGSDLEYAIRLQPRYRRLAAEGLLEAAAVTGSSRDVLTRCAQLVPGVEQLAHVVPPGVDAARFRPRPRDEALLDLAGRLDADPETRRGRPSSLDEDVRRACEARDGEALDALAHAYDQTVPDPAAGARLRTLSTGHPIVGYFGKLIPQKGVSLLLRALPRSRHRLSSLIVGFGLERERLTALAFALAAGDEQTIQWLLGESDDAVVGGSGLPHTSLRSEVVFTGRLDHRYAPDALAAMDVLVVPSVLEEAFGMVAAEGAAAGSLPLLARHSGLGEVAAALEGHVGRPQLFSFEPGPGAPDRIATGIDRLIELQPRERNMLREAIRGFVADEWSWRRTAAGLLNVAGPMT
jgi:glycosyltransferase involved in cell wall biosynthesis